MNEDIQIIRRIITPDIIPLCNICGEIIEDDYCILQENYEKYSKIVAHEQCFKEIQHLYKIQFTNHYMMDKDKTCICCNKNLELSKTYVFTYWRFDQDSRTQYFLCENCFKNLTQTRKEYINSLAQKIKEPLQQSYSKERILFKLKFR
jgi:hypothetical protein